MTTQLPNVRISPLSKADYSQWLELWQSYLTFYKTTLSEATNSATWTKLLDTSVPIYGFGAYLEDKLIGITHVVIHPNTWNITDCCYLEDLYVSSEMRGYGVGRALIEYIYEFAKHKKNCNRVYWTTQEDNNRARRLYDTLADKTDMVQYRHNL